MRGLLHRETATQHHPLTNVILKNSGGMKSAKCSNFLGCDIINSDFAHRRRGAISLEAAALRAAATSAWCMRCDAKRHIISAWVGKSSGPISTMSEAIASTASLVIAMCTFIAARQNAGQVPDGPGDFGLRKSMYTAGGSLGGDGGDKDRMDVDILYTIRSNDEHNGRVLHISRIQYVRPDKIVFTHDWPGTLENTRVRMKWIKRDLLFMVYAATRLWPSVFMVAVDPDDLPYEDPSADATLATTDIEVGAFAVVCDPERTSQVWTKAHVYRMRWRNIMKNFVYHAKRRHSTIGPNSRPGLTEWLRHPKHPITQRRLLEDTGQDLSAPEREAIRQEARVQAHAWMLEHPPSPENLIPPALPYTELQILESERELTRINRANELQVPPLPVLHWTPIIAKLIDDRNNPKLGLFASTSAEIATRMRTNFTPGQVWGFRADFQRYKGTLLTIAPRGLPASKPELCAVLAPFISDMAELVNHWANSVPVGGITFVLDTLASMFDEYQHMIGFESTNVYAAPAEALAAALLNLLGPEQPLYAFMMEGSRTRLAARSLWT